jgi:hypothetical protein
MKNLLSFLFVAVLITTAIAAEPWEGRYVWNNSGKEELNGHVHQSVTLDLSISDASNANLSCEVNWTPGMDADFGAIIDRKNIIDRTLADGTVVKVIPFSFEDSNGNKGTGEVEIKGLAATLRITVTNRVLPEAARQYGTYQLGKQTN